MEHPITPPPELVEQWRTHPEFVEPGLMSVVSMTESRLHDIATQAAHWGADQELEACITWVAIESLEAAKELRAARRPKSPSLKEQALEMLECIPTHDSGGRPNGIDVSIIRRALEQLDD